MEHVSDWLVDHLCSPIIAQCLYVLSDDNPSFIEEIRSDAAYAACLLSITREGEISMNGKAKDVPDVRGPMLRVLCCGMFSPVFYCSSQALNIVGKVS